MNSETSGQTCWATGSEPTEVVEGTLAEARCYLAFGLPSGDNRYCSFVGIKAGAPAGLITDAGQFIYLAGNLDSLADYAGRRLRVYGTTRYADKLLAPERVSVLEGREWISLVTWHSLQCDGRPSTSPI